MESKTSTYKQGRRQKNFQGEGATEKQDQKIAPLSINYPFYFIGIK